MCSLQALGDGEVRRYEGLFWVSGYFALMYRLFPKAAAALGTVPIFLFLSHFLSVHFFLTAREGGHISFRAADLPFYRAS